MGNCWCGNIKWISIDPLNKTHCSYYHEPGLRIKIKKAQALHFNRSQQNTVVIYTFALGIISEWNVFGPNHSVVPNRHLVESIPTEKLKLFPNLISNLKVKK